jgi:hypothetical protein
LCWDWAAMFETATSTVNPKCWLFYQSWCEGPRGPNGWDHWWLSLWACKRKIDNCRVMIDDGFIGGTGYVHFPPWPPCNEQNKCQKAPTIRSSVNPPAGWGGFRPPPVPGC